MSLRGHGPGLHQRQDDHRLGKQLSRHDFITPVPGKAVAASSTSAELYLHRDIFSPAVNLKVEEQLLVKGAASPVMLDRPIIRGPNMRKKPLVLSLIVCPFIGFTASTASAAPVVTAIGADLSRAAYTFTLTGSSFTFGFNGDYFGGGPITIATANGGQVNTVFGSPSTSFVDRGVVTFGPTMQYAAFSTATPIRFTNGQNFIGLRALNGDGSAFYGYAYTTNNVLNSIGFETIANTAITATTAIGSVPEPTSWAMMILGLGAVGGLMRRRSQVKSTVRFV